LFDIAKLYNIF